jgi:hypothetical protein
MDLTALGNANISFISLVLPLILGIIGGATPLIYAIMKIQNFEKRIDEKRGKRLINECNRDLKKRVNEDVNYYNRACGYALIEGMSNEAIMDLEEAIKLNTENRDIAKYDSEFDKIRHLKGFEKIVYEE